jgi:hypothetical protein
VVEPGGEADFAEEPLGAERGAELGMERFERDSAVVPEIVRDVDRSHSTAPELALGRVAVGQRGLQLFEGLDQRDLSDRGISRLQPRTAPCDSY